MQRRQFMAMLGATMTITAPWRAARTQTPPTPPTPKARADWQAPNYTQAFNQIAADGGMSKVPLKLGLPTNIPTGPYQPNQPPNFPASVFGFSGPTSSISAWNGAAVDKANSRMYYPYGGGHADWGWPVVSVDYVTLTMSKLALNGPALPYVTKPGVLAHGQPIYVPADRPPATHTYGTPVFHSVTKKIYSIPHNTVFPYGSEGVGGTEVWETNPVNMTRRVAFNIDSGFSSPTGALEMPDGKIRIINENEMQDYSVDGTRGPRVRFQLQMSGPTPFLDTVNNCIWFTTYTGAIYRMNLANNQMTREFSTPIITCTWGSFAWVQDGYLYLFNGREVLGRMNLTTKKRQAWIAASGGGPRSGKVFTKAMVMPAKKGIVARVDSDALWCIVPPKAESDWVECPDRTAQSYVDAGQQIPPGVYPDGIRVTGGTWDMKGVTLGSVLEDKAFLLASGTTVVKNFRTSFDVRSAGTRAGLRGEGNFNLTVEDFYISRTDHGILTGNLGTERLTLRRGTIEDTGGEFGQTHPVYAGAIADVVVDDLTVRRTNVEGHQFKTRAFKGTLTRLKLLGGANESRCIDISEGGDYTIADGLFVKSPAAANHDMIAFAPEVVRQTRTHRLVFSGQNVFINQAPTQAILARFYRATPTLTISGTIVLIGNITLGHIPDGGYISRFATIADARNAGVQNLPA